MSEDDTREFFAVLFAIAILAVAGLVAGIYAVRLILWLWEVLP